MKEASSISGTKPGGGEEFIPFPMTVRFEHEQSEDGNHLTVTGRKGELECCEEEPIHAPGAIQSYGVLIAFDRTEDGRLVVAQVSENSSAILGLTPTTIFNASCLTDLLSPYEADVLLESIDILDERESEEGNVDFHPYGFELSGSSALTEKSWSAYAAMHRPNKVALPERFVLELELKDQFFASTPSSSPSLALASLNISPLSSTTPLAPSETKATPAEGGDSELTNEDRDDYDAVTEPTQNDLWESTVPNAAPLKEMVRLKRRREREVKRRAAKSLERKEEGGGLEKGIGQREDSVATDSDLHVVQLLGQVEDQLARATDLPSFYKITSGVFKELSEFDRAMIYEFDENWNGEVVAEQVDYSRTKDLYRGLHFPATDIPAQARELYKLNKVRLLFDRTQRTSRMCCRDLDEVERGLDMSQSFLRAMSPIHLVYLANMGVRSTMSISIVVENELWGLVALHNYGAEGHRVSFPIRSLCRLLSESIGRNIERLRNAKRLEIRNAINAGNTVSAPVGYILASGADILSLFKADFGFLSIGNEVKLIGNIGESEPELLALMKHIRKLSTPDIISCVHISSEFKEIVYPHGFQHVAGFMSIPLARRGKDFIVFCRRGQAEEIRWGGNPNKNTSGKQVLNPRNSFKAFRTNVVGKSRSWVDEQQDTPTILLLTYGKFIDVWRSKEALASTNRIANQLMGELDVTQGARTPLTSVVNYLDIALDGALDDELRASITSSHSQSLVRVINEMLILSRDKVEGGNTVETVFEGVDSPSYALVA